MTSQINYTAIDATFPVAGQDNDSQGFRDNFAAVKTALQYAKGEITDLQSNGAVINGDNDFGGNQVYNAEFKYNSQTVYNLGTVSGAVSVNYQNAQIQTLTTSGNITLSFLNWPTSTKMGSILLFVTLGSGSHTITYPDSVETPALWSNPNTTGTYLMEFTTTDNGSTIYVTAKGYGSADRINKQIINASTATTTINYQNGTYCIINLQADTTIVFSPLPTSGVVISVTLLFIQDATGNHSVTYTPVVSGFNTIYTEDGQQPLILPTAFSRCELQNVLDTDSNTLRIRQGVIGEIAIS